MTRNITILIRDDVSHDLDSCMAYSKESGKTIPICYDERNTQLKEGVAIKPHSTNIVDGKIKRTDRSMDGSKLERTGECIPCWTNEELLTRVSKEDVLGIIEDLLKKYKLRSPSFGQAVSRFKDDMEESSIAVYIIEYQQQAQRYEEGLRNTDAGGTEFYWTSEEIDKPGEALKNRLEQYTSETIATENWNQKSKGTYRLDLLARVQQLISSNEPEKYVMVKCRGNKTTIVLNAIAQTGDAEFVLWSGRYPSAHSGPIDDCSNWQELKDYYGVIEITSVNDDVDKLIAEAKKRRHNNPPKAYLVIVNLQKLEDRNETANEVYEQLKEIKWNHKIIDESGLGGNTAKTMDKLSGLSGDIIKLDGSDHTTIITKCTAENSVIWLAEEEFEAIKAGKCPSRPQKIVIADKDSNLGDTEYKDESENMSVMMRVEGERQDARFVEDIELDIWKWVGETGMPTKGFTYTSLKMDTPIHISISGIDQCYAMENLFNEAINPKLLGGKKLYPINLDKISGSPSQREDTIKAKIKEIQNNDNKSYQEYATAVLIGDGKLIRGAGIGVVPVNYNSIMKSNWTDQLECRAQNWSGIVHPILSQKDHKGNLIPVTPVFERNPYRSYKVAMAQAKVRKKIDEMNGKEDDNIIHQIDKVLESTPVWLNSGFGGQPNQLKSVDVIERVKKISSASDFTKGELNTNIVSAEEVLGISTSSNTDTDNNDKPGKGLPREKIASKKQTKKQKDIEQAIRTILGQVPKRIYIDPTIDSVDALCSAQSVKNIYNKVKPTKDNNGTFTPEVVERILRSAKPDMEDTIKVFREKVITGQVDYEAIIKVSAVKSNADISLPLEVAREMVNGVVKNKLPNVVLTCQDGSLVIALLEKGEAVDLVIGSNPDDIAFAKKRIKDTELDVSLVKDWKVCYNRDDEAFETTKEKYMNKTDINIFTNWPFQQGNQGAWVKEHYKFKPLLGKTGTMVAHSTTQFVSGTQRHKGILMDLQESDTTYLDMSTETRFKPKIGARAGYYVTSNSPYSGKTTIKTIDGKEIDVDITKYPALPCVLSSETWEVFEEINKIKKDSFDSFKETDTVKAEGRPHIVVPKAQHISWNKKEIYLDPKKDKLPTSRQSLLFDLTYYNDQERKSLCSQMDLSITRFWLAIMGWLDSRSGGWICRSIPMWGTDEIYDDSKFFKKYPTLVKHKGLILELAAKIKPNE